MGPPRYGRQAKLETGNQKLETSKISALVPGQIWKKFFGFEIGNNKHFAFEPRGLSLKVRGLPLTSSPLTPHALLKVIGSSRTGN